MDNKSSKNVTADDVIERLRFVQSQGGGYDELAQDCITMIERLRAALTRLGSMEAFCVSRPLGIGDDELRARIDFAREALSGDSPSAPPKRHSSECDCHDCHYAKKHPQIRHHALCGCWSCTRPAAETKSSGWQPIATAPKDRFILLYCPRDSSRWLAAWQGERWYGVDDYGLTRDSVAHHENITQWMPIPATPDSPVETSGQCTHEVKGDVSGCLFRCQLRAGHVGKHDVVVRDQKTTVHVGDASTAAPKAEGTPRGSPLAPGLREDAPDCLDPCCTIGRPLPAKPKWRGLVDHDPAECEVCAKEMATIEYARRVVEAAQKAPCDCAGFCQDKSGCKGLPRRMA